ncbi:hypothetical protein [Pelagibacterium halotolerans]|uniref:hypothetical protein n=1 Tax=Pelagibacterium halotolerans TaxID=531813 RepID=UPI00384EA9D2
MSSGRVGANIPAAYRAALPIEDVEIWSCTAKNARDLAETLRRQNFSATAATNLEAAVGRADIVSSATLTREPILKGIWLKPGQHLDLIGSLTPDMRKADDDVIRQARVFLDTDHAKGESGDIRIPLESGVIDEANIAGTLQDLCRHDLFRRASNNEITLFKGVATAIEDLSAAALAAPFVSEARP